MTEYGDIYLMRSKGDNIPYVGISVDYKNRRQHHKWMIKNKNHHNVKIKNYCIKYRKNERDFYFSIIEKSVSITKLEQRETYWINYYNSVLNGFNIISKRQHSGLYTLNLGNNRGNRKLNNSQVICIIENYLYENKTTKEIANIYKVSEQTIKSILYGKNWIKIKLPYLKLLKEKSKENIKKSRLKKGDGNTKECIWNGIKYSSITLAAEKNNHSVSNFSVFLKKGYTKDEDIKTKSNKPKKISINEFVFESIASTARYFFVARGTIKYWLKTGKASYID